MPQVVGHHVAFLRRPLRIERRQLKGDQGEVQRHRLHRHAVGPGALLLVGDAAAGEPDVEVGFDLILGRCRPLDVDPVLEGAGHRVLQDLRRSLVGYRPRCRAARSTSRSRLWSPVRQSTRTSYKSPLLGSPYGIRLFPQFPLPAPHKVC